MYSYDFVLIACANNIRLQCDYIFHVRIKLENSVNIVFERSFNICSMLAPRRVNLNRCHKQRDYYSYS